MTYCDVCDGAGTCLDGACLVCATTGDREAGEEINAHMMRVMIPENLQRLVVMYASRVISQGITFGEGLDRPTIQWSVWFSKRPPRNVVRAFHGRWRRPSVPGARGVILDWSYGCLDAWIEDAMLIAKARGGAP